MKDRFVRFSAMLLVLWYCFSVIGFNVHTCNASGRSFVATFISGLTCADIHPGHVCDKKICSDGHQKACCQHHHEEGALHECLHSASCCSDDHVVLAVTGCTSEDNSRHQDVPASSPIGFNGSHDMASYLHPSAVSKTCGLFGHTSRLIVPGDLRSLLSVWRI